MKTIDLTHIITETMPVYPGTEQPKLIPACTIERDKFRETLIKMYSHTGTHTDAPAHLYTGRTTLDKFDTDAFVGSAVVIDCRDLKEGEKAGVDRILKYGSDAEEAEFLLFDFGWDAYWGKPEYFGNYPCPSKEAVEYAISKKKKGIGLNTISIDSITEPSLPNHRLILEHNDMIIIENLTNLDKCPQGLFTFCALPLRFENADGAPTRAIAIL